MKEELKNKREEFLKKLLEKEDITIEEYTIINSYITTLEYSELISSGANGYCVAPVSE